MDGVGRVHPLEGVAEFPGGWRLVDNEVEHGVGFHGVR
jgi:hypothetical protein